MLFKGFTIHWVRGLCTGLILVEELQQCDESVSLVHLMQAMNLGLLHPSCGPSLDPCDLSALINFHKVDNFQ